MLVTDRQPEEKEISPSTLMDGHEQEEIPVDAEAEKLPIMTEQSLGAMPALLKGFLE